MPDPNTVLDDPQQPAAIPLGQLQAFVTALIRKRDNAIAARAASGIEDDWLEDEEHYQGIDDGNRGFVRAHGSKPDMALRRATAVATPEGARSTVFLNITRPYVDAAAARLADMLLPVDERCFAFKPTPIASMNQAMVKQVAQALVVSGVDPMAVDWQQLLQVAVEDHAKKVADLMEDAVDDHLVECGWHGEVRAVIEDCARIGSGVLKGPIPQKKKINQWQMVEGRGQLQTAEEITPGSKRIDPWNFYPDGACGENIHNGDGTWEREFITGKQLRDLKRMPGYIGSAIDAVLLEGAKAPVSRQAADGTFLPIENQFELWTRYGAVAPEDATASGLGPELLDPRKPTVDALVLMVNDQIIKFDLNHLDTGEYPYDVLAWQRRPGMPWGVGVGRHLRTPQRMLNAACRAMLDNAGFIAGMQLIVGNGVTPSDGKWEFRGKKLWRASPDVIDVTRAFWAFVPPSVINEMLEIIQFARDIAEQTTGMPMLLQGQQTEGKATDTLGGMQLLQNNATGVLRRLAKRFDDFLTGPHIRRYYSWMMQYSDRSEIKGDLRIDVRASSALIERDSQKQFMLASMSFATDPAFGIHPYKLFSELCKADRMDSKKIQIEEKEYEKRIATPSALDEAKTTLANAQAEHQAAQATLAKVQAMFSAINTANLGASNPALAPAADATLGSAGFKDANAAPAIGPVAPGSVAQPMPSNTSPLLPPVAPSPVVGVGQGIEGGTRDDPLAQRPQGQP